MEGVSHFLRMLWNFTLVIGNHWAIVEILAWAGGLIGTLVVVAVYGAEDWAKIGVWLTGTEGWLLGATSAKTRA